MQAEIKYESSLIIFPFVLQAHPEARDFRFRTLPNLEDMKVIFSGVSATGTYSATISEAGELLQTDSEDDDANVSTPIETEASRSATPISLGTPRENSTINPNLSQSSSSVNINNRNKKQRISPGEMAIDAINSLSRAVAALIPSSISASSASTPNETSNQSLPPMERAIAILQDCYQDKLTDEDMITASSIFENETKARVFVCWKAGITRDKWLQRQIQEFN